MEFSDLVNGIAPNILQVLENKKVAMERAGRPTINLSAGTPDLPPAHHVQEAVQKAATVPANYRYSLLDLPPLSQAVLDWYARRYGVSLTEEEYMSLNGTQEGFAHIFLTICNPGDLVIVGTPGYPVFSFGPLMAHAELYPVPLTRENDYLMDFDGIDEDIAHRAKAIVVSYPSNPLCVTAPDSFYTKLIAFAKKYNIIVIHDNAYSEYVHDGSPAGSFLRFPGAKEVGIEFNSLSKSHNLTGLRISFALGNKEIIRAFKQMRNQIDYGVSFIDQHAAIAALQGPDDTVQHNRREYRERRDIFCMAMREIGWDVPNTPATMFTWFPVPKGFGSEEFALLLMERAGVICVPGNTFGSGGEGWLRFALVQPKDVLAQAALLISQSGLIE